MVLETKKYTPEYVIVKTVLETEMLQSVWNVWFVSWTSLRAWESSASGLGSDFLTVQRMQKPEKRNHRGTLQRDFGHFQSILCHCNHMIKFDSFRISQKKTFFHLSLNC